MGDACYQSGTPSHRAYTGIRELKESVDVVLIGGGIMSATLGVLLQELEPSWSIKLIERLDSPAAESSGPWNNAGTGHAALCELNYSPQNADGTVRSPRP